MQRANSAHAFPSRLCLSSSFLLQGLTDSARNNVIWWTNGGPGCSGIGGGLFSEMGPFRPRASSNGTVTLYDNLWTWANFATIIFIEQPAGVGFSYSGNTADYTVGDARSAADFWAAIQQWMLVFPDYAKKPLWITGESYGGHYVPTTSAYIVKQNLAWQNDSPYQQINFAGLMVGNAWSVAALDNEGAVNQWMYHQVISPDIQQGMIATCNFSAIGPLFKKARELGTVKVEEETVNGHLLASHPQLGFKSKNPVYHAEKKQFVLPSYKGLSCNDWQNQANLNMANVDIYCALCNICLSPSAEKATTASRSLASVSYYGDADVIPDSNTPAGTSADYNPCIDTLSATFLNYPAVQQAIGVNPSTIPSGRWSGCSSVVNYSYSDLLSSMVPTWQYLLQNAPQARFLVFSGSEDLIVPTPGTLAWIDTLNLPTVTSWHPWLTAQQETGGFAFTLAGPNKSQLHFATVRGAGHLVPTTQNSRGLQMAETFVNGGNL